MRKNTSIIYVSELVILLAVIVLILTIKEPLYTLRNVCIILSLGISLIILISFFGLKKNNNYLKNYTTRTLISLMMVYIIIIYGLGVLLGFSKGFKVADLSYFKSLFAMIAIILETEYVRYIIAKNSFGSKKPLIIFTILSVLLGVLLEINVNNLLSSEQKFIFLSTIIFPIIAEEILCSYMTYKISLTLSIIYKFVIKLYMFILPIVPDLGDYIYSSVNVLYPYIIYLVLNKTIIKYEKIKADFRKANITIFSVPLILFFVVLVILVSGIFKYKLIAIASNSMHPTYSRGDAVIYEKINPENIEIGDILVFTKEGKVITHRVIKKQYKNNSYHFNTKGDNNDSQDAFTIEEASVLGKVDFSFKYIGYPTVKINEVFGKE